MTLNRDLLKTKLLWLSKAYHLPEFDIEKAAKNTYEHPTWLHFGAGNIFRCFPALAHQKLLDKGLSNTGIVVCEMFDEEIIDKAYTPFENLNITVTAKADGSLEKTFVASITQTLKGSADASEIERIFINPSLQIVSFTITEKGYRPLKNSLIETVSNLLRKRFETSGAPLALVSLDNCSHNGDVLKAAVMSCVNDEEVEFLNYLTTKVSFPLTMIDKITPRPSERIQKILAEDGIKTEIICTSKQTYVSSFVNAESTGYLVIEDNFPNGRPPLEKAGIIFTDAETVDKVEKMKVCTCLNPLHTVLAIFGCILGYKTIWEEMKCNELKMLIEKIGYEEGLPVVIDPEIINPREFLDAVINERLPNSFVPDTPQRIACDTSQKISVRFGETLKTYIERKYEVAKLEYIPFFFAGYLRYLQGINDEGAPFKLSPDPRLDELSDKVKRIDEDKTILMDKDLFGIDLVEHGVDKKVMAYFKKLAAGNGAVRKTLYELLNVKS